ncbi:MAG: DNA/RNA non-specific endonuclease [Bacteroidia bacterium]|nr:DNA/RNA non-specific endonuclease [Bacteroidia bacterium]
MRKQVFILFFLFLVNFCAFPQKDKDLDVLIKEKEAELFSVKKSEEALNSKLEDLKLQRVRRDIQARGLPKAEENKLVVNHSAMTICWDDDYNIARWVAHIITPDIIYGAMSRTNDFRKDSLLRKNTADKNDYWNSGYDRGHLAPSADFKWSKRAVSESYFYSNMAPQRPELNRERWADMEDKLRKYVAEYKEQLYVVTGGILKKSLPAIGEHQVTVPELFYKVVLDYEGDEKKGIGFIMPNGKCEFPVMNYAVSIDSVEKLAGIDFFASLSEDEEQKIESSFDIKKWYIEKEKDEELPLDPKTLPKKTFNTVQAKVLIGEKATVCGTVVSTKYHEKSGGTFINLDQKFPNQIFTITIWKTDRVNFSYTPEKELPGRKICVTGIVDTNKGVPSMTIKREKDIHFLDDDDFDTR